MSPAPEQTLGDKAIDACQRYVRAQSDIARLTKGIGEQLAACPSHPAPHLSVYYRNVAAAYGADDPVDEVAGAAEFRACPFCVKADKLIQERKDARKALASAKRLITTVGRA